jgi:hypothetical protein
MDTLTPGYERRTWILAGELHRHRTSMLMVGINRGFCEFAAPRVSFCTRHGDVASVRFPSQSSLDVLAALQIGIRAFGPGCHVNQPSEVVAIGRRTFAECRSGTDETAPLPRTAGRPPDVQHARFDIARAYAEMLAPGGPNATLVEQGPDYVQLARAIASAPPYSDGPSANVDDVRFVTDRLAMVQFRISTRRPFHKHTRQYHTLDTILTRRVVLLGQAVDIGGHWRVSRITFCAVGEVFGGICDPL